MYLLRLRVCGIITCNGKKGKNMMKDKMDITVENYDNIVKEYMEYYELKDMKELQFQREIDYITSNIKEGSNILDVGTAIGTYSKFLTEQVNKKFNVIGIDASKNMIEVAKKKAPKAEFQVMDVRKLNCEMDSFEAIICFAVVHHIDDKTCTEVLDKFDDMLKIGGLIAINTHELMENQAKESMEIEPLDPKRSSYFNRYTKDFFMNYFHKKNYEVLKIYDNPMFDAETVGETFCKVNQFSIIAKKIL